MLSRCEGNQCTYPGVGFVFSAYARPFVADDVAVAAARLGRTPRLHKHTHNVNILKTKLLPSVALKAAAQSEVGFHAVEGS